VRAVNAGLAAINRLELSMRLAPRDGHDEFALLVRTINETLERLDQARREAQVAVQRQRRFAADASHELLTPLAGLRAELEEARLHPDQTDLGELLEHALGDVDRLQAIVADLLILARTQSGLPGHWEQVDLAELVCEELAKRSVSHKVQPPAGEGIMVTVDCTQIRRMLGILLDNADRHARNVVEVRVLRNGSAAELVVSDDGAGIAQADRERVFEPFTRLDECRSRDRGGTGLGLAIARQIALVHDGSLCVEESPLGGAQFVLHLPIAALSPGVGQSGGNSLSTLNGPLNGTLNGPLSGPLNGSAGGTVDGGVDGSPGLPV
jgi:signal transduction histidine kinase